MKKKVMAGIISASILLQSGMVPGMELKPLAAGNTAAKETVVEKRTLGNPILGFDDEANLTYGGDPSVLEIRCISTWDMMWHKMKAM